MRNRHRLIGLVILVALGLATGATTRATAAATTRTPLDVVTFGDVKSEQSHRLDAGRSEAVAGALGQSARRLLALDPPAWEGGRIGFTMKVDPNGQNYLTARFWGDEIAPGRLMLYADGKQIGWRHLGEVDPLDFGASEPPYAGRFYYNTAPLPRPLTKGKTELRFEIRSTGAIWGYGRDFKQYQKLMAVPSRAVYRVYTHTDGCFEPPADEVQGTSPADPPTRARPGMEVLDQVQERVNREIDARLNSKTPISQMQMQLLAKAYDVKWTRAHQNEKAIEQITRGLDALFAAYRKNPRLAREEPSTWNPDWFGLGVCGQVIALRKAQLEAGFDEQIDDGQGGKTTRRAAFTEMLVATVNEHRLNRRLYTNQTMLNDLNGIYHANRGVAVLSPERAMPEKDARRYLYEAVGLEPWRNSDPGGRQWSIGENYMQLTAKGLTKELGYVGSYGEVIDLVADIYDATRPARGQPGDERIKAQLVKIARARAAFRHPTLDFEGNRAMRLEQVVGWRDSHHPGYITYAQRATRDASALQAAVMTLDPHLLGYAHQMLADNQFFASEVEAMKDGAQPLRTTIGRLETPDQYETLRALPPSPHRLPMTWDQPDSVFCDEENGVLALKRGEEILYVSLYWRARTGINHLARVHCMTPRFERIAVVAQQTQFDPSGLEFTWPNWTNFGFGGGGPRYPDAGLQSAYAGQKFPIAKIPPGIAFKPGDENVYAGKGTFYTLRYGAYLIGMNCTADRTFALTVPPDLRGAKDLVAGSGRVDVAVDAATVKVGPRSTVVLCKDDR